MDDVFMKYMNQRFQLRSLSGLEENHFKKIEKGPVITISREVGCDGNEFARLLAEEINTHFITLGDDITWKWVNKQILFDSADELEIDVSKIKYVFNAEKKGMMDEIVGALSAKYYKNDRIIRKTIKKVVDKLAAIGHIIIVGRGGVAYTRDLPNSLHVKLMGPLSWRIEKIATKHGIPLKSAEKYVNEVDGKRKQLIDIFMDCKTSDCIFDVIFNCKTMDIEERLKATMKMLEIKHII